MRFGIWLPSYTFPRDQLGGLAPLKEYLRRVDSAGLDIWTLDELLSTEGLYGTSWTEAITTLAYAASQSENARLGTGVLVLPLRDPVILAKQIASLDYLSGGRLILGVGAGGSPSAFDAVGAKIRERGQRMDEMLTCLRLLLTDHNVSFEGRYYQFHDVTIQPHPDAMPPIWIAGGSRLPDSQSFDRSHLATSVRDRIVAANGWLSRCSGTQESVKRDWTEIRSELLSQHRDLHRFVFGHCNFIHVVDTEDQERAWREQEGSFAKVMGTHRTFHQLRESYLCGTPADQVARLLDLKAAGCNYVVLGPTDDRVEQFELLLERVIKPVQAQSTDCFVNTNV